jgi:hypothetical protein
MASFVKKLRMNKNSVALTALLLSVSTAVWAGCKSDCQDEYDSEVESCQLMSGGPDDSDTLQMCVQSAKDEYDSCIDECDS